MGSEFELTASVRARLQAGLMLEDRGYETPCLIWKKGKIPSGYGMMWVKNRNRGVHVVAYVANIGPVPEGLVVDHLCNQADCANPAHLEAKTQRENVLRGRGITAKHAKQSHCLNGHAFDERNTLVKYRRDGSFVGRRCRACHNKMERDRTAAKKLRRKAG